MSIVAASAALLTVAACQPDEDVEMDDTLPAPAAEQTEMGETGERAGGMDAVSALGVATLEGAGEYLTTSDGRAVYLFTADSEGSSTCYDACAQAWPPVLASSGAPSADAPGIDASLIGTMARRDGSVQVTYNDHPLYFYAQDQAPGATSGQDIQGHGGEWYLVTPDGSELEGDE